MKTLVHDSSRFAALLSPRSIPPCRSHRSSGPLALGLAARRTEPTTPPPRRRSWRSRGRPARGPARPWAHGASSEGRFADADRLATQAMASSGAQRLGAARAAKRRSSRRRARSTTPSRCSSRRRRRRARAGGACASSSASSSSAPDAAPTPSRCSWSSPTSTAATPSTRATPRGSRWWAARCTSCGTRRTRTSAFKESVRARQQTRARDAPLVGRPLPRLLRSGPRRGGAHARRSRSPQERGRHGRCWRGSSSTRRSTSTPPRSSSNEALAVDPKHTGRLRRARRDRPPGRGPRRGERGDRRGPRRRPERPGAALAPRRRALPRRRQAAASRRRRRRVFARNKEYSRALRHHRRLRGVGAPLRRRHRDDEGGRRARPEGRQGLGAARACGRRARATRQRGREVPRGVVEARPLQRPRLQHAREALHAAGFRSEYESRTGGHLRHPLPEGRARGPRALRAPDARRGVGRR